MDFGRSFNDETPFTREPPPRKIRVPDFDFNIKRKKTKGQRQERITAFNPEKFASLVGVFRGAKESKKTPFPKLITGFEVRPIPIRRR